jgi:hypothetical protein
MEALDVLFAAVEADRQREVDTVRSLARRLRQALVDLDLYELASGGVESVSAVLTLSGTSRQVEKLVELLEKRAEAHRRR